MLRMSVASVLYCESNRTSPSVKLIPRIIDFLGYHPYDGIPVTTAGEKIVAARRSLGLTQEELARMVRRKSPGNKGIIVR